MIKKRNLDPSLIQWIMTVTGLGPGIGEIFYVAPAASATSQYRTQWQSMGVEKDHKIYTKPSLAYAAMVASRNDVMLIAPGAYAETTELAWNKSYTHAIGLGGPRSINDYSEPGVAVYTVTATQAPTVSVAGNFCQFHGITFDNNGAHTSNTSGLYLNAYGGLLKGCSFHGVMNSTQKAGAACCALNIGGSAGSFVFDDCVIGDNQWTVKNTATQSQLRFIADSPSTRSNNGLFKNCRFRMQSETATCVLVYQGTNSNDRIMEYNGCTFSNFSANWANVLTQVFQHNSSPSTNYNLLIDCAASGFSYWNQDGYGTMFQGNNPVATVGGGLCAEPVATIQ